jgi:RimJ/RimL family protein N-acetyltransferase
MRPRRRPPQSRPVRLFAVLIQTDRLRLRPMTVRDVDQLLALHAHPDVSRFAGAPDRQQALEWLRDDERQWAEPGHGRLAVFELHAHHFLGRVGLKYWPQFDETEVGWTLRPEAWGRGYATEAARACVDRGFREFDFEYLTAMIRPDNVRSVGVAERLGMTPLREDVVHDTPVIVHAVDRETWAARSPDR